ncbi:uncharacterized protein [Clytia hemisphaerica]
MFDMLTRHSRNRYRIIVLSLIFVTSIYVFLNKRNWAWYNRSSGESICETPEPEMKDLIALATDTRDVLHGLKMTYFLIYGSLWGALRHNRPLAWDNDFDIGLVYEELKDKGLEQKLYKELQKKNIKIYYRLWFGTYRVTRDTARGDLMIYRRNYFDTCVRLGMESWVFFVNYRKYHQFPCRLIKKPLPSMKFSKVNFTVPREGNEIQKHFYPEDWWVESKPSGC